MHKQVTGSISRSFSLLAQPKRQPCGPRTSYLLSSSLNTHARSLTGSHDGNEAAARSLWNLTLQPPHSTPVS
jgi:hypothetical protein